MKTVTGKVALDSVPLDPKVQSDLEAICQVYTPSPWPWHLGARTAVSNFTKEIQNRQRSRFIPTNSENRKTTKNRSYTQFASIYEVFLKIRIKNATISPINL